MILSFKGPEKRIKTLGLTHASDSHCRDANRVTTCTIKLQVSAGTYTADVAMFDQSPVNGHIPTTAKLLSTATQVPFTVKSGKVNRLKFKPAGVIASLAISGVSGATAGTAFASAQSFAVTATDADGYVIVGPYETAVTLADSDTTGATSIATSGTDAPPTGELLSSSDTASLNYTGLAIVPATITASTTGVTAVTGMFTPSLQLIVIQADAFNPSYVGVDLYATSGAGSTATFSASELGWTNAPYNKTLSASTASGCSTIATLPTSGASFTVTVVSSPSAGNCTAMIRDTFGRSQAVTIAYTPSFAFTGAQRSFTVPAGVTRITVDAVGASGGIGNRNNTNTPGLGEEVKATLSGLTSGETLYVYVGGAGGPGVDYIPAPGFNGGGPAVYSGGGGGASDVRTVNTQDMAGLNARFIVAGGGGGAGGALFGSPNGGNAGFAGGSNGGFIEFAALAGGGGLQNAPGAGGTLPPGVSGGFAGVDGQLGIGGGNSSISVVDGGAGGGGYYGGGSGYGYGSDASSNSWVGAAAADRRSCRRTPPGTERTSHPTKPLPLSATQTTTAASRSPTSAASTQWTINATIASNGCRWNLDKTLPASTVQC